MNLDFPPVEAQNPDNPTDALSALDLFFLHSRHGKAPAF